MIGCGDHHVVRPCRTDVVDTSDIESVERWASTSPIIAGIRRGTACGDCPVSATPRVACTVWPMVTCLAFFGPAEAWENGALGHWGSQWRGRDSPRSRWSPSCVKPTSGPCRRWPRRRRRIVQREVSRPAPVAAVVPKPDRSQGEHWGVAAALQRGPAAFQSRLLDAGRVQGRPRLTGGARRPLGSFPRWSLLSDLRSCSGRSKWLRSATRPRLAKLASPLIKGEAWTRRTRSIAVRSAALPTWMQACRRPPLHTAVASPVVSARGLHISLTRHQPASRRVSSWMPEHAVRSASDSRCETRRASLPPDIMAARENSTTR